MSPSRLHPPQDVPGPVGYVCALKDLDGSVIEISHNQKVFSSIQQLWGHAPDTAERSEA